MNCEIKYANLSGNLEIQLWVVKVSTGKQTCANVLMTPDKYSVHKHKAEKLDWDKWPERNGSL